MSQYLSGHSIQLYFTQAERSSQVSIDVPKLRVNNRDTNETIDLAEEEDDVPADDNDDRTPPPLPAPRLV